ncbi:MAG: dCTP deaminase [Candidatus Brennerbacteria bacterium]|nr:dCTP deaminase [Candidatus Brennerbacteria bacterium]
MILTGKEIEKEVQKGRIIISPFRRRQLNPNSYNFRLGRFIKVYRNRLLNPKLKQKVDLIEIPRNGLVLDPRRLYLGHTEEIMGSNHYVPIIRGRSSIGRVGLFIHITADLIDIGSVNQWTLQLHTVQKIRIYRNMLIGQVTFWVPKGKIRLYGGKYQNSRGPMESQIYKDFISPRNKDANSS